MNSDIDITFNDLALALANDYRYIYCIDKQNGNYVEYGFKDDSDKISKISSGADFFTESVDACKQRVYPPDQEKFWSMFDEKNFRRITENGGSFNIDYRLLVGDTPVYHHLKTINGMGKNSNFVFIGVSCIGLEKKNEEERAEDDSRIFVTIANALASRYELLYYIDVSTGKYMAYTANDSYAELKEGEHGNDFFSDAQKNSEATVHPEDKERVKKYLQRDNFLTMLKEDENISITYRLMVKGKPQYMNFYAVKMVNDDDHVIIAVSNITATKLREMEMKKALGNAINIAEKDALTSVNSKYAYDKETEKLDEDISGGSSEPFAVALFDLNGLKEVNDTKGHAEGDEYIKEGCDLICNIFAHSPVYRIGGDEFVVLLRNKDYVHKKELLEKFRIQNVKNKNNGKVTLSVGVAEFEPKSDRTFRDVFEKADMAMYRFKQDFKAEGH